MEIHQLFTTKHMKKSMISHVKPTAQLIRYNVRLGEIVLAALDQNVKRLEFYQNTQCVNSLACTLRTTGVYLRVDFC